MKWSSHLYIKNIIAKCLGLNEKEKEYLERGIVEPDKERNYIQKVSHHKFGREYAFFEFLRARNYFKKAVKDPETYRDLAFLYLGRALHFAQDYAIKFFLPRDHDLRENEIASLKFKKYNEIYEKINKINYNFFYFRKIFKKLTKMYFFWNSQTVFNNVAINSVLISKIIMETNTSKKNKYLIVLIILLFPFLFFKFFIINYTLLFFLYIFILLLNIWKLILAIWW